LVEEELDSVGNLISRQLQQIWFSHPKQIEFAQRFTADFALWMDGTFRMNALNLVFIVTAGVTNCNSTFVSSLSCARSEAKLSFDFIFQSLKKHIFYSPIPPPRVVISDQASGLKSSLPAALPDIILQFCDWHAARNIEQRLAEKGYTKEIRNEIKDLIWRFIKSETAADIEANRQEIYLRLQASEIEYLEQFWRPKEKQILRFFTRRYSNLGAHSNQRSESIHPVTKEILNKQLSLEEAARRFRTTIQFRFRQLTVEETNSGGRLPRTLD
jgi:MULE transposase domain